MSDGEVCPVCQEPFVHTTDAPVSLNSVGERACVTSFGLVVFHGPEPTADSDTTVEDA